MNEKIKELAKESGFCVYEDEIFVPTTDENITKVTTKFAELIVKECASVLETKVDEGEGYGSYENGAHQGLIRARLIIKNHFGVE